MDQRLKKMERKLAVSRGGTSKRARKQQNRQKAAKEDAKALARKQAKENLLHSMSLSTSQRCFIFVLESCAAGACSIKVVLWSRYLEGVGNNWAAKLQDGVRGTRFTSMASSPASELQSGLVTAGELHRKRESEEREQAAARAAAAKQRVEEAWAEAEAKRAAEQVAAAHKRALKTQRNAERMAQQKALSFSLDDEDEDSSTTVTTHAHCDQGF